ATADTLIELEVDDPSAIDLPPFAVVPAGRDRVSVLGRALRPTRALQMAASMGGPAAGATPPPSPAVTTAAIGGLVLSEAMPSRDGGTDGAWVEIAGVARCDRVAAEEGAHAFALDAASSEDLRRSIFRAAVDNPSKRDTGWATRLISPA